MVLDEAPGESVQQTWYSRLARERRELSVSVEEALVNTPREDYLDDQSQCATVVGTGKSNNVFPPRLSLQSRALPGVPSRVGTGLVNTRSTTAQHTNIWTRFVHRLKSSLSAFGFHSSVAATPALPPNERVSVQSAQMEDELCPSSGTSNSGDSQLLSTDEVSSKTAYQVVTGPSVRYAAPRSTQGRQRLAGRATRIRLEVVPAPSSVVSPGKEKSYLEHERISYPPCGDIPSHTSVLANPHNPGLPAFHAHNDVTRGPMNFPEAAAFDNRRGTSVCLPAIEKVSRQPVEDRPFVNSDRGTTSIRLPAVEKVAGRRKEPSPAWRVGTGKFECGQRDVTVSDPSVTASSVVLATLTANPGPVAVQYVSLQPGRGFTLHLTAPTMIGAPFNYVVLGLS